MTIAQAFNEIAVAQGGTPSTSGTIAGAIDALNDALAGSDQKAAQTIEDAVRLLGQNIGSGGGGGGTSTHIVYLMDEEGGSFTDSLSVYDWDENLITTKMRDLVVPDYDPIPTLTFDAQDGIVYSVLKNSNPKISGVELSFFDVRSTISPAYALENGTLSFTAASADMLAILTVS